MIFKNIVRKFWWSILKFFLCLIYFVDHEKFVIAQYPEGSIILRQGTIVGLKIFPETSQMPVYSYLGIPYAQPPIGHLRFAPPEKHPGWNKTMNARDYKPICPQLENYVFDEVHNGYPRRSKTDENCLFLNIWTPQSALRNGNFSVLVIITGEEQAFDWTQNRPSGLDLASEGVLVVTIQSRTNVFGWLTLRNTIAPGNLGLLDQYMAMQWIQENIEKFGGNPKQVTLLGHGTSGATNAMLHLTSTKEPKLFSKLIIMSGTIYSSYSYQSTGIDNSNTRLTKADDASKIIIKKMACESSNVKFTLDCLRQKSVNDLLKAFEQVYQHGNYTTLLGPQEDDYLPSSMQYLGIDPKLIIEQGKYANVPIMIGICSNEGAFMQELWIELAREGYESLKSYVVKTILPNVLIHYGFNGIVNEQIKDAINWRFFDQIPQTAIHLLNGIQRILSETKFESPFLQTIEKFVQDEPLSIRNYSINNKNSSIQLDYRKMGTTTTATAVTPNAVKSKQRKINTLYVYTFHASNTMDIRGSVNFFGGASHTSDLLYLMGPSLFQQIGRRKLSSFEMKLCKKIRTYFTDFTKNGNPTPGRLFDAWRPYTPKQKYIHVIGESIAGITDGASVMTITSFEQNTVAIENLLNQNNGQTQVVSNSVNPYRISGAEESANPSDTNRMSKSYLGGYETSQYYNSLIKINSFWNYLLPKIYRSQFSSNYGKQNYTNNNRTPQDMNDDLYIAAIAGDGSKFKHAFFSMLVLVCLLLAVLCVCVYILKKNHQNIDTSFL